MIFVISMIMVIVSMMMMTDQLHFYYCSYSRSSPPSCCLQTNYFMLSILLPSFRYFLQLTLIEYADRYQFENARILTQICNTEWNTEWKFSLISNIECNTKWKYSRATMLKNSSSFTSSERGTNWGKKCHKYKSRTPCQCKWFGWQWFQPLSMIKMAKILRPFHG